MELCGHRDIGQQAEKRKESGETKGKGGQNPKAAKKSKAKNHLCFFPHGSNVEGKDSKKEKKEKKKQPRANANSSLDSWKERKVSAKWFFVLFLQLQI